MQVSPLNNDYNNAILYTLSIQIKLIQINTCIK